MPYDGPQPSITVNTILSQTNPLLPFLACATPIPTFTPTLPYGLASIGFSNNLNMSIHSAQDCCNLCYFGLQNCVQAWYFFYEGCSTGIAAPDAVGNRVGVTASCPKGQLVGLTYRNDSGADFRSTGDFAGPCGQTYNNI